MTIFGIEKKPVKMNIFGEIRSKMIHYLKNKVGVVDFANAQGVVMF